MTKRARTERVRVENCILILGVVKWKFESLEVCVSDDVDDVESNYQGRSREFMYSFPH